MDIQKEMRETISKNIIFYRKKCGLTQAQLADKVGYTDKSISKWERGESVPDVFILKELANIFGIKVCLHKKKKCLVLICLCSCVCNCSVIICNFLNDFSRRE